MPRSKRHGGGSFLQFPVFLLLPGLALKRWVALAALGGVAIALGIAFSTRVPVGPGFSSLIGFATLRDATPAIRGGVFVSIGIAILSGGIFMLARSLASVRRHRTNLGLLDSIYVDRVLGAGPRIVAIGGGTGLATLLRGLKHYTTNITAVVTVADDGGSSGRLRTELGIPPPGDIRNCLAALADSEDVMQQLLDYRFSTNGYLDGHNLGNMLIAALARIGGGFDKGVEMAAELLAIRGKVIPATPENVTLVGSTVSGQELVGESRVGTAPDRLRTVQLLPPQAQAHPDATKAIWEADLIVLGPGSLFTSIVPNLLVEEIAEAVSTAKALKMYIVNVAEQPGETDGLSAANHLDVVRNYGSDVCVDVVIANDNCPNLNGSSALKLVEPDYAWSDKIAYVLADVIDEKRPEHHDSMKLASTIAATYRQYRGVRRRLRRVWRQPEEATSLTTEVQR